MQVEQRAHLEQEAIPVMLEIPATMVMVVLEEMPEILVILEIPVTMDQEVIKEVQILATVPLQVVQVVEVEAGVLVVH